MLKFKLILNQTEPLEEKNIRADKISKKYWQIDDKKGDSPIPQNQMVHA